MEDGTNFTKVMKDNQKDVPLFQKSRPNNITINISKYIAKYDFDIAMKLNPDFEADHNNQKKGEEDLEEERNEQEVRQMFDNNSILEILQECSNTLAEDDRYYESLWTLDGKQIQDLNSIDKDTKMLLCSYLPMIQKGGVGAHLGMSRRMQTQKTRNLAKQQLTSRSTNSGGNAGLQSNEYAINNWSDFYNISLKRAEQGLTQTKDKWFNTQHSEWQT